MMSNAGYLLYIPILLVFVAILALILTAPVWGGVVGGFLVTRRPLVGAVVLGAVAWLAWQMAGRDDWRAVPSFLFLPAVVVGLAAGLTIGRRPPSAVPPPARARVVARRCPCGVPVAPVTHLWSRMGYCSRRCWERVTREGGG